MKATIIKTTRNISRFLWSVAGFFVIASTLIITANTIMRYFFGDPFTWSDELSTYLVIIMVFLALPFLEYSGNQLCIGAILSIVKSEKGRRILVYVRGLLTLGATSIMTYFGFSVTYRAYERALVTYVLHIPKYITYGITAACFVITIIVWLVIMGFRKGEYDK